MKTIEELKKQESIYLDLFIKGKESVLYEFSADDIALDDSHVLYAYYSYEEYSGSAYVLFIKDDKIYEVSGGHCSCYGLEGQFEPEEVPIEVLYHRLENKLYNYYHLEEVL